MKKAGGTEDAAKETIKQFIAHIPSRLGIYNLIDILNTIDDKERGCADCLGKTTFFACLAEMLNHELFSKLRTVHIPYHLFLRVKSPKGDKDIETVLPYKEMESKSEGQGIERGIKSIIPAILDRFYCETFDGKILDEILDKYPTFDLALANKALESIERNDIFEAGKYIDRALEIFPDEPNYLKLKGDVEYEKGNKRAAREYYERAVFSRYANKKIKRECLEDIVKIDRELNSNMHA